MNEAGNRLNPKQKPEALKKLADHLNALDAQSASSQHREDEMLSLIISGILNGEELESRYPAFHQKLLENAELRQAFLDALEAVEAERAGQMIPLPGTPQTDLPFLASPPSETIVEMLGSSNWRAVLQRSLEQMQVVFSPPRLAYRADASLVEDPWFTLLREEITAAGIVYAVRLECTLSSDQENALSTFLNLAVTVGSSVETVHFPLRASLQWGDYQRSVQVTEEGRVHFPDIVLDAIYDPARQQIRAGLRLVLETTS